MLASTFLDFSPLLVYPILFLIVLTYFVGGRIFLYLFGSITFLIVSIYFLGQTSWFQTWAAQKATVYLSKELNTKVDIKGVSIKFVKSVVLEGLYVEDLHKDTLLYTQKLTIDLNKLDINGGKFSIRNLEIEKGRFTYKELKNGSTNLSFIINYFSSGKPKDTTSKPFKILVDNIKITDFTFAYKDDTDTSKTEGMNYSDIVASHIFLDAKDVSVDNDFILADIKNLSAKEKCGFTLNKLAGNVKYSSKEIEINKLQLLTPNSNISNYLAFRFKSIGDFNHFVTKVHMDGHFKNSRVNFKDISFFAPAIKDYTLDVKINGDIKGTVADLKARGLDISTGKNTHIKGDFSIKGLPEINSTQMDMDFERLNTSNEEVNNVFRSIDLNDVQLPEMLNKLGDVDFKGTFNGKYNNFAIKGALQSAIGKATTDLAMDFRNMKKPLYKGKVDVADLNLGIIAEEKSLGKTSLTAAVDGQGFDLDHLHQDIVSNVEYFEYNGYKYSNISIDGLLDKKNFNGKLSVNDKNLMMDFKGNLNLNDVKTQGDFYAEIKNADFRALHLMKDTLSISTSITSKFIGNSIDNILGYTLLENTELTTRKATYKVDTVELDSKIVNDTTKEVNFKSDFVVASLSGKYKISEIPVALQNLLRSYLPAYKDLGKPIKTSPQKFTFGVSILDINPLTSIFIPDLNIPEKGSITGSFDSQQRKLTTSGLIRKLNYKKIKLDNLIIDQGNSDQSLFLNLAVNKLSKDSLEFNNVGLSNYILDNNINSNIKLADPKGANSLDLNSRLVIQSDSTIFSILPSELKLDNQVWKIDNSFRILFGKERFYVDHFTIRNGEQELEVEGAISKNDNEPLVVNARNLNLKTFNSLIKGRGIELEGFITGNASTSSVLKAPKVTSDLIINNLTFNNNPLGDAEVSSRWYSETNEVNFSMNVVNKGIPTISLSGSLQPTKEEDNLFADIELNETSLSIFQPFLIGLVSNLKGTTSANVLVKGTLKKPIINGSIAFNNAGVKIDYLNTEYSFNDKIGIENGKISFNRFLLKDIKGHTARANGSMDLSKLIDPYLDIRINATDFQALNTSSKENDVYYGSAYATGNFRFKGPLSNMEIDIKATTEPGTKFFLPISSEGSTGDESLVEFVSKDTTQKIVKKENDFSNLTLNFDLTVTDAAEAQIIFDESTGEIIRGKGNANLSLRINTQGKFEIFGLYNITEGEYNFKYKNLINKPFKIMPGGSVRFNGDPYDASLNVKAYYPTRTSLAPLYADARVSVEDSQKEKRVLVNTIIKISNTLSSMDYDFDIEFPQEASLKENTFGAYFTEDNSQKQAISLLATNNFMSGNTVAGGTVENSAYELASSTLSGLVNQFIGSSNFDFNAKFGGSTGSTEFGTNVRLLNNRLIINGSFVSVDPNSNINNPNQNKNSSTLTSDIDVEYLLSKEGNLRAVAFNHSNSLHTSDLIYETAYMQGLGLRYKKEFDTWKEFFQSFKRQKQLEEEQRKKRQEERQKQNHPKTEVKIKKEGNPTDTLPDNADELILMKQ